MPRKRDPVPRARAAGHWLSGILLLGLVGGGMVSAAMLLWENLDIRQLAPSAQVSTVPGPLPMPEAPSRPAVGNRTFTAFLLNSPSNRSFFPDTAHYPRALRRWRRLVEAAGGIVTEVPSLEGTEALDSLSILVIPEAPCLSDQDLTLLRDHLESGGSLVTNWAVGARDEKCEWRGWGSVAALADAEDVREVAARQALYLTVPAGTPFSPGVDPGTRIEFRSAPSLAIRKSGPRVYWADWALNPAPDESGGGADAAASVSRSQNGGRAVWFGFQLSHVATPMDSTRLDRVVENGIRWAAGVPVASLAAWPDGRRAALVIAQDVEAEYANARAMASLVREVRVPGTFFAVSQLVRDDRELALLLAEAGEVGSHTDDHAPLQGLKRVDQELRLRKGWTEVKEWTGVGPLGLRPPEETFDTHTLQGWLEAGGRYLLAVNQARSGSPEIYRFDGEPVVLLPRLLKDDYNVFVQDGALRAERLSEAFLNGMGKIRSIGGFASVVVHTQIVGTGRRLDAIRSVVDTARAHGDWWIAQGGEVAEWWRKRGKVRMEFVGLPGPDLESNAPPTQSNGAEALPGPSRTRIEDDMPGLLVRAPADEAIHEVWVEFYLPHGWEDLNPMVDGAPVSYRTGAFGIRVPVGDLEAGEVREVHLRPTSSPSGSGSDGG